MCDIRARAGRGGALRGVWRLAQLFEWHRTLEHRSWLSVAEGELSLLARQCLSRRLPDRPAAPHLNGKAERSQQTDRVELWAMVDASSLLKALEGPLGEWQRYYNWERPHSALAGSRSLDRCCELLERTPSGEDAAALYSEEDEPWRERNYQLDLQQLELKRSQ